jgi:glycosyltransferase involved in cell wall biosynthesis
VAEVPDVLPTARRLAVPTRVLMLRTRPGVPSPLETIVPLLAESLRERGYRVDMEYWGRRNRPERGFARVMNRLSDIRRIRRRLSRMAYDVLFIHTAHDWKTLLRDVPLLFIAGPLVHATVVQIHGSLTERLEPTGHRAFRAATRSLTRKADAVILCSTVECDAFRKFDRRSEFHVAYNPYEPLTGLLPEAPWRLPHDRPIVLFAARLIPEKGILDLLDAMPEVLHRVACHLLVAGAGVLERELTERLARPPLAGHGTFVGHLDRARLSLALTQADIFVLPTYHIEGFPHVVQEAFGHGVPVITTPTRGLTDHLIDGIHGRLVPPRDPPRLAAAIIELLEDSELRRRMSEASRRKARDFSPAVVTDRYVDILEELLRR